MPVSESAAEQCCLSQRTVALHLVVHICGLNQSRAEITNKYRVDSAFAAAPDRRSAAAERVSSSFFGSEDLGRRVGAARHGGHATRRLLLVTAWAGLASVSRAVREEGANIICPEVRERQQINTMKTMA